MDHLRVPLHAVDAPLRVLEGGGEYKGSNVADREYFISAKNAGKTTIGDIVLSKTTNKLISVICVPLKGASQQFVGVLGLVLKVEFITDIISSRFARVRSKDFSPMPGMISPMMILARASSRKRMHRRDSLERPSVK